MSTKPNIPEEEIDLGNLFSQIGKMFSNFFAFIENIFKAIYHYLILFILFVRKNTLILGLATLIGIIVGYLMSLDKEVVYKSEMSVETFYEVGNRLYNQIDHLNKLISEEDSVKIGEVFDISSVEAATLSSFSVEPIDMEKNMYLDYDEFIENTDTIFTYSREFTFEEFLKRKVDTDVKFHKISAEGTDSKVFVRLNNGIKVLVENDYYKNLKEKKLEELSFEKEKLINNLSQIDSLRKRYKETAYLQFEEKDYENSGVSFRTINPGYRGNLDKDLYHISDTLMLKLKEVNYQLVNNDDILKVQSEFTVGEESSGLLSKTWLRFGVYGFVLSFLTLIGLQFNRYLNKYQKNIRP